MRNRKQVPVALTIAGSDSGGGAGIQADLKTFAALGVHGTSAITCVTAQNPKRVLATQSCRPEIVRLQLEAVFSELPPAAIKTGMLFSAEIIHAVAEFLRAISKKSRAANPPVIVDPVMISTSGAALLKKSAVNRLTRELFPLASLITPNLDEAAVLLGWTPKTAEDLRRAAKEIHRRFGCAALVKGGHLRGGKEAADIFFDGKTELLLSAPFVSGVQTHGTGCTYSAAIAGFLARGETLVRAVELSKNYISRAIARSHAAGTFSVLNHFQ
ncbi:MAG TPA: bifunctional hydroxymethylpyrimidine kinase/phosphomethylpyrimidine kinase [Verrucomicrobiae bacterium]|nr:bifunctional hydroxymethylpyrimidine kinase/phosphomethylpyrimidine kinase [Verrucomicrobiae bacterium]